jgi:hypothetical protein
MLVPGELRMRKRQTREHVIADLSVNHVERLVLRRGWTVERTRFDYGIDLDMHTYSPQGEVENGNVLFLLKATDNLKRSADGTALLVRLQWRDLLFWLNEGEPVILILYDAQEDRAYWLYVQEYFRKIQWKARAATATTVTVRIPSGNILDESAIRLFARFRDERCSPGKENLHVRRIAATFGRFGIHREQARQVLVFRPSRFGNMVSVSSLSEPRTGNAAGREHDALSTGLARAADTSGIRRPAEESYRLRKAFGLAFPIRRQQASPPSTAGFRFLVRLKTDGRQIAHRQTQSAFPLRLHRQ